MRRCARLALVALALGGGGLTLPAAARPAPESRPDKPELAVDQLSDSAQLLVEWVRATRNNGDWPFIVIDKVGATVFAYDADGELLAAAPALLGMAQGDDSTPGIGKKSLARMGPAEKTTPAGRFVAKVGRAAGNKKVLWVDYSTSVALHPIVTTNKQEKRLKRLNSATPDDNRITFGCINVTPSFFRNVIQPNFSKTSGIVYILPETKQMSEAFPGFLVAQRPTPVVGISVSKAATK